MYLIRENCTSWAQGKVCSSLQIFLQQFSWKIISDESCLTHLPSAYDTPKNPKDHMHSVLSSSHTFNIKPPLSLERQGQHWMKSCSPLTLLTSTRGQQSHLNLLQQEFQLLCALSLKTQSHVCIPFHKALLVLTTVGPINAVGHV